MEASSRRFFGLFPNRKRTFGFLLAWILSGISGWGFPNPSISAEEPGSNPYDSGNHQGGSDIHWELGGSGEIRQSRFLSREESRSGDFYTQISGPETRAFLESREEQFYGSGEFRNSWVQASFGHRYKPFPGFFLGRDQSRFSSLIRDQPLVQSGFFRLFPGSFSPGIFLMEGVADKTPAYSFSLPDDLITFTYSPESKIRSLALNIYQKDILFTDNIRFTALGEFMGTQKNYFGNASARVESKENTWFWESRLYKNPINFLPDTDPWAESEKQVNTSPLVATANFGWGKMFRTEWLDYQSPEFRQQILGLRIGLWDFGWGGPCIRFREYRVEDPNDTINTGSWSFLWIFYTKYLDAEIGREIRANGDRITEAGFRWKKGGVRIQTSLIHQAEGNQILSPFERVSGQEVDQVTLTDHRYGLRFRIRTNQVDFNISGSEAFGRRGYFLYGNIQIRVLVF